jgi:hypothetical protein
MMASGSAVQTKGLGSSLVSGKKRLMAAWRSAIPVKTLRLSRRLVSLAKKALDRVEPGGRGRGEVELKALLLFAFDGLAMAIARSSHFGMLIVGAGMMFVVALVLKRLVIASIFFFCV